MKHLFSTCLALLAAGFAGAAHADPEDEAWLITANFELWGYGTRTEVRNGALLNPGNRIAQLANTSWLLDGRFNLRAEQGAWQLVATPRLLEQVSRVLQPVGDSVSARTGTARLGQGFVRYKDGDLSLTAGRELFTWGPANFRSPSSPFYFDAGRTNPVAATPGIDLVRGTVGVGSLRLTGAYVAETNQLQFVTDQAHTALFKLDQQGDAYLLSLVLSEQRADAKTNSRGPFFGGFAQWSPDDAWLLYGEFGSARQPLALTPNTPDVPGPFYIITQPAPRSRTLLLGANYTLENGQVLVAEWLHDSGGYRSVQTEAYFQQAARAGAFAQINSVLGYAAISQALGQAPRLLGRDYLWLNWQSNPQSSTGMWRVGWTQNSQDASGQMLLYGERNFMPRLSGFMALTVNRGGARTDFGALWRTSLATGLKWYLF